jgi:hypothetical protein
VYVFRIEIQILAFLVYNNEGRIIDIQTDSIGQRIITTKGDANPSSIPGTDSPIKKDNYIGKVISVITRMQK